MRLKQLIQGGGIVFVSVIAVITSSVPAYAYSTGQIDKKLPNGTSSAANWDGNCRNWLSDNRNARTKLRTLINTGASYLDTTWLSGRYTPNVSMPITVLEGTNSIPLQINSSTFLCSSLVSPDLWPNATTNVPASPNAGKLADNDSLWVKPYDARDRPPNRIGSINMWPARVDTRTRIDESVVVAGGGVVDNVANSELRIGRDDGSRYWFSAPINLNYNEPAGITSDRTVQVRIKYRTIAGYNAASGGERVEVCAPGGPENRGLNSVSYNWCPQMEDILTIRIKVIKNKAESGAVASGGCRPILISVRPGKDVNGDTVPINVSTPGRDLGTYANNQDIDVTSSYTTGDQYTVTYRETRSYISGYTPIYENDENGNPGITGYQPIVASPQSWSSTIGPCYDYSLTPQVDLGGMTTIESGGEGRITSTVVNGSDDSVIYGPTKTLPVDWRLSRLIFAPGVNLSPSDVSERTTSSNPCAAFTSGGRIACDSVQEDTSKIFPKPPPSETTAIYNYLSATNLAAGTQVCFVNSVSRPTEDPNPVWRHSALKCMIVSKKPKLQVRGSDVRASGKIETGLSSVKDSGGTMKTYGSWVEYGALSVGMNTGFASGSGLNNGGSSAPSAWNLLTFANIDNAGAPSYGYYAMPPRFASLTSQFTTGTGQALPTANVGGLASGTYTAGDVTLTGTAIGQDGSGKGRSIVIISSGTVTLGGDITYSGPGAGNSFSRADQLPQLIIVAKNINISGAVKSVDAWLITSGTNGSINTCSDLPPTASLNSAVCSSTLTINGPIVTSHLFLRRTAGAEDGNRAGNPAEILNLRADAYLWAQNRSSSAGKAQTVYTSTLPPRF